MSGKPIVLSLLVVVLVGAAATVQAQQNQVRQPPTLLDRLDEFGREFFDGILPGSKTPDSKAASAQKAQPRRGTSTDARPRYGQSAGDEESRDEAPRAGSISRPAPRLGYSRASDAATDPDRTRGSYSRYRTAAEQAAPSGSYRTAPSRASASAEDTMDYSSDKIRARSNFTRASTTGESVSDSPEKAQPLHERMSAARRSAFGSTASRPYTSPKAATVAEEEPSAAAERESRMSSSVPTLRQALSSDPIVVGPSSPSREAEAPKSEPTPVVEKPVVTAEKPVAQKPAEEKAAPAVVESAPKAAPAADGGDVLLARRSPILSVETVGPRRIAVGKESKYEITMINSGEVPADDLLVTLDLPAWTEVKGGEASVGTTQAVAAAAAGRQFQWKLVRLDAKSRERLTVRIVPKESRPFDLAIKWTYREPPTQTMIEVQEPKLTLSLEGPREVLFGKKETYRLRVANVGTGDADNVVIKLFPLGTGQTGAASHNFGTVPAGQDRSIEVELTARQTGTVPIKVEVTCDGSARAEIAEKVVVRRAALDLEIAGAKRQYVDAAVAYRIRVSNSGSASAADVVLTAAIPEGVKFQSATENGQLESGGRRVRWKIDVLRPGAEKIVELKGTLTRSGPARLQVDCTSDDLTATAMAVTEVEAVADLVMDVTDPTGPVAVGQEVTYEVRIQNRGSKAAEEMDLVAFFSQGIEPVAVEGVSHRISLGQVAFDKIPALAPGGELRVKIRAKAKVAGNHAFRTELQCRAQGERLASEKTTYFYGEDASLQVLGRSSDGPATARRPVEGGATRR